MGETHCWPTSLSPFEGDITLHNIFSSRSVQPHLKIFWEIACHVSSKIISQHNRSYGWELSPNIQAKCTPNDL